MKKFLTQMLHLLEITTQNKSDPRQGGSPLLLLVAGFKCSALSLNTLHHSILWFVKRDGKKPFGHDTLATEPHLLLAGAGQEPSSKVFNSPPNRPTFPCIFDFLKYPHGF